jgi:hypothetical protein
MYYGRAYLSQDPEGIMAMKEEGFRVSDNFYPIGWPFKSIFEGGAVLEFEVHNRGVATNSIFEQLNKLSLARKKKERCIFYYSSGDAYGREHEKRGY